MITNIFYLRSDAGTTTVVRYQMDDDYLPITGDWDDDGASEVGFCELTGGDLKNKFYLQVDSGATIEFEYKKASSLLPVSGNWDGTL